MKRWMILLLYLAKGILLFLYLLFFLLLLLLVVIIIIIIVLSRLFPMSVKPETASDLSIRNWTVWLYSINIDAPFGNNIFCTYASILVQLSLFVHQYSLSLSFRPYRERERERKEHHILLYLSLFLFLFLPKILPASVHIYTHTRIRILNAYTYQSEVRMLTRYFFLVISFLYWPNLAQILLLFWFLLFASAMPTYKNRVCTRVPKGIKLWRVYIYRRVMYDSIHILFGIFFVDLFLLLFFSSWFY